MTLEISALVDIAIILIVAKILGEAADRAKFPVLLGELAGGLLLGGLAIIRPTAFMNDLAGFGILFLFFMLGLTLKVSDIRKDFGSTFLITAGGTVTSFAAGFFFGYFMFADAAKGLFVGVAVMSTSTAIALKLLHGAGELNTKAFNAASAVSRIDDVLAVLMITVLTSMMLTQSGSAVLLAFAAVLAAFLVLEKWLAAAIGRALGILRHLRDEYIVVAVSLVLVFVVSFLVENIGIGSAIGAFLVGQALSKSEFTEQEILPKMKTIGYGFFIPIFFTYAALLASPGLVLPAAAIVLLALAMLAKFAGTAALAWREGYSGKDLQMLGAAMMPRGEYAIAIAFIAVASGFIDLNLYSMIIIFVLLTILATPLALRAIKRRPY